LLKRRGRDARFFREEAGAMDEVDALDDRLDFLLGDARHAPPPGLAARLTRGALDAGAARRVFWLDLERAARGALGAAAAAAVIAAALAAGAISRGHSLAPARPAGERRSLDEVAGIAVSPKAFERDLAGDVFAAAERRR
jgi:hypothetical protein